MILNLETGEILCKISNTVSLFPASWWGDAFLFLKKLKACDSDESVKLQVVTFDFSQRTVTALWKILRRRQSAFCPDLCLSFLGPLSVISEDSSNIWTTPEL